MASEIQLIINAAVQKRLLHRVYVRGSRRRKPDGSFVETPSATRSGKPKARPVKPR